MQLMPNLWCKGTGMRFNQDMYACWIYQGRSEKYSSSMDYPRVNRRRGVGNEDNVPTSLRRYVAGLFYDLDEPPPGVNKIWVLNRCQNKDCVNPRHMLFFDHPRVNLKKVLAEE